MSYTKPVLSILFLIFVQILFTAAQPSKKSIPPDLTTTIEKKWPGSDVIQVSQQNEQDNNTVLYKIVRDKIPVGWAYTRRVLSCRDDGCKQQNSIPRETVSSEYFDYFALLSTQYSILEIKVYNYAATHGQEICSKAWLKQFKGFNGSSKLRYGKDIDAISGATISGRAITQDVGTTVSSLRK